MASNPGYLLKSFLLYLAQHRQKLWSGSSQPCHEFVSWLYLGPLLGIFVSAWLSRFQKFLLFLCVAPCFEARERWRDMCSSVPRQFRRHFPTWISNDFHLESKHFTLKINNLRPLYLYYKVRCLSVCLFVCQHSNVRLTTPPVLMLWGTQAKGTYGFLMT